MSALYGIDFIGLCLSNVLYDNREAEPSFPCGVMGYVDVRDVASVVGNALEVPFSGADSGAEAFGIAATDSIMKQERGKPLAYQAGFPRHKNRSCLKRSRFPESTAIRHDAP